MMLYSQLHEERPHARMPVGQDYVQQAVQYSHAAGEDPSRQSLPSIQNLIGLADRRMADRHSSQLDGQLQSQSSHMHDMNASDQWSTQQHHQNSAHNAPPTPPMRNDGASEMLAHSPSTISSRSSVSALAYTGNTAVSNDGDAYRQRHQLLSSSAPQQPVNYQMLYQTPQYSIPSYPQQPTSLPPAYSAPDASYAGMYQQKTLPSNYSPATIIDSIYTPARWGNSPPTNWDPVTQQYYPIYNPPGGSYSASQDRYMCPTCNKAFSRPSSLKIHQHSHTGEKPFQCPHPGCGKAFSVRSNMKRHERGCHPTGRYSI